MVGTTQPSNGFICMDEKFKCSGDSRDATYNTNTELVMKSVVCNKLPYLCHSKSITSNLTDHPDDFMVVAGVNHKKTEMATYTALAINSVNRF